MEGYTKYVMKNVIGMEKEIWENKNDMMWGENRFQRDEWINTVC
jgi:hypothetical protein